jgi:hypothetical protein
VIGLAEPEAKLAAARLLGWQHKRVWRTTISSDISSR